MEQGIKNFLLFLFASVLYTLFQLKGIMPQKKLSPVQGRDRGNCSPRNLDKKLGDCHCSVSKIGTYVPLVGKRPLLEQLRIVF